MPPLEKIQEYLTRISEPPLPVEDFLKRSLFQHILWLLGVPVLVYGVINRGVAAFSKTVIDVLDISYCMIALMILFGWIVIGAGEEKPKATLPIEQAVAGVKNLWVKSHCVAQQSYRLPFPYGCQIYHLLNLKHLEKIHRFSLGNLKVMEIIHFQKTQTGGRIRFKTSLNSSFNALRIWRRPSVDVDLILHTPYQIELKVPVYRQKFIHVLFSVLPLNAQEHQLCIQMFSDLQWPKELLGKVLLFASNLTLLEDLPYLSHLAKREVVLIPCPSDSTISSQGMQLFRRYIDLYGTNWDQPILNPNQLPL